MKRRQLLHASVALAVTAPLVTACGNDQSLKIDSSLPVSSFDAESTAEDVTQGMDLSSKTALVTGCNSGIGLECMRVLALRGAHVIGTGRTMEKATKACASVAGNTTPMALELSDFQSAVDCAESVKALGIPVDIVIANAGISGISDMQLVDGIERTFRVNHLGHFVLVNNLLPMIEAAPNGRIVHVGSAAAYFQAPVGGIVFDSLRGEVPLSSLETYGQSKLANALFSLQLSKNLDGSGTTSNVIHPGLVQTSIARNAPALIQKGFELLGPLIAKTPAQGAATQMYVATHPNVAGVSGAYFEDCNPVIVSGSNHMSDEALAERLWQVSLQMTEGFV
jgi:NAD(P)-dependent dehydrogenase (short-subunit alcohol dehydrogenase family)